MVKKVYLPMFGNYGEPATGLHDYPALPGDRVRLIRCADGLTGEISYDLWIAKKESPSWQKISLPYLTEKSDLNFILLAESEVKIDEEGRLFADFLMKPQSPLAVALAAVAAVDV